MFSSQIRGGQNTEEYKSHFCDIAMEIPPLLFFDSQSCLGVMEHNLRSSDCHLFRAARRVYAVMGVHFPGNQLR